MATGMPDATDPSSATAPGSPPRMSLSRLRRGNDLFAVLVTAVLVGLGLFLVAWSAPVLGPLGLGLFLAGLAAPLFGWLEHRGRSAPLALAITIAVLVVAGGAIVLLGLTAAQTLTSSLDTYAADIQARYDDPAFPVTLRELIPPDVLVGILRTVTGILVQVGSSLIFAMVIAALFLLDGPRLARLVAGGLGSENPVFRETPGLARAAVTYFLVRVRINAVTALSLLVLMLLVGVDHALLWAVGVFVLSFVPYLGLIVALIPPTILAFAESGLPAALVIVLGGTVLNVVAENILEPTLTGRALSLTTWVVFAMFFLWVWLLGPVGALLSMPITLLVVLVLDRDERTRWVADLLTRKQVR